MSLSFAGIPTKNYVGAIYSQPMQLFGQGARYSGRYVPLLINWLAYGGGSAQQNLGITVQLSGSNQSQVLQKVISVYIDNDNSLCSIYVIADDTGFTVSAAPNTSGWQFIVTNSFNFHIYATGMIDGSVPQSKIYFTDAYIPANVDPAINTEVTCMIGSPQLQRSGLGTPPYFPPALGDQNRFPSFSLASGTADQAIAFGGTANQFLYFTQIQFCLGFIQNSGAAQALATVNFQNNSASPTLISCPIANNSAVASALYSNVILLDIRGNFRFQNNLLWSLHLALSTGVNAGVVQVNISFTVGNT